MKLSISALSLFLSYVIPSVGAARVNSEEFIALMEGRRGGSHDMRIPRSMRETLLATTTDEGTGRRLQCRDTLREGQLSITVDCCGSGVSDLSDCSCSISVAGDRCRSCYICSNNEDIAHDCRDEACGTCAQSTCSGGCQDEPCPDDDDDDSSFSSPTTSRSSGTADLTTGAFGTILMLAATTGAYNMIHN